MEGLEVNVSQLLHQNVGATVTQSIDIVAGPRLDGLTASPVRGRVRLIRTNFGILAEARLYSVLRLECDRCLEPYDTTLTAEFAEEYLPVVDLITGRPVQSDRAGEAFYISPNHVVDLTEAARQHLLLAIPMRRVCGPGCRGLCPHCGAALALGDCGCGDEAGSVPPSIATVLDEAAKTARRRDIPPGVFRSNLGE